MHLFIHAWQCPFSFIGGLHGRVLYNNVLLQLCIFYVLIWHKPVFATDLFIWVHTKYSEFLLYVPLKLTSTEGITVIKDGATHKLIIHSCSEEDAGKYRFEAAGRKSEAMLIIQGQTVFYSSGCWETQLSNYNVTSFLFLSLYTDPPKIDLDSLKKFQEPVIIRAGENASFNLKFMGLEPMKVQWFKEGDELLPGLNVRTDSSTTGSSLLLTKCQRKDTGEVQIKIKNEHGTIEATTRLIVLGKSVITSGKCRWLDVVLIKHRRNTHIIIPLGISNFYLLCIVKYKAIRLSFIEDWMIQKRLFAFYFFKCMLLILLYCI